MNTIVNLISGPRNISTALMYSFAQRPDFKVLDEPFYGYYLKNASLSIEHPSQEAIMANMECDKLKIIDSIMTLSKTSNVFVKGMAHHYLEEAPNYLMEWNNVILIRHPRKLIASFAKVIEHPTLNDIGIKRASEIFLYLRDAGKTPIVIDSDELMINPGQYLKQLCELLGISFLETMLAWNPGGIPEDGIWAKHWYKNVHQTIGFQVQQNKPAQIPVSLGPLLAEAMPYYETLQKSILKND